MFNTQIMNQQPSSQETRREFIKTSAAAALAAPFVLASSARGQDSPGETLRVGLIGCCACGSRRRRRSEKEEAQPRVRLLLAFALSQARHLPKGARRRDW